MADQNYGREGTYEEKYDHPIKALRKDIGENIMVRIMDKEEMPDDGITYYADTDCSIYTIDELELEELNKKGK